MHGNYVDASMQLLNQFGLHVLAECRLVGAACSKIIIPIGRIYRSIASFRTFSHTPHRRHELDCIYSRVKSWKPRGVAISVLRDLHHELKHWSGSARFLYNGQSGLRMGSYFHTRQLSLDGVIIREND